MLEGRNKSKRLGSSVIIPQKIFRGKGGRGGTPFVIYIRRKPRSDRVFLKKI